MRRNFWKLLVSLLLLTFSLGQTGGCLDWFRDKNPPTVQITNLKDNSTLSGIVTIQVNATDNVGVIRVEFYIDGNKIGEDISSPYEYNWDTDSYANGIHLVMVKAYDNTGNVGESPVITVNVQNALSSLWKRTFGGSKDDEALSIQQTADGGYIVAGFTESFGEGKRDVYIIKLDEYGKKVWEKTYGRSAYDEAFSIQQTADGGYIVAGYTDSFGAGGADVYIIKLDADGNKVWEKIYGGSDMDEAYSIQQTADGGYIVAGFTESFETGGRDFYIIKLDKDGNTGPSPIK